MASFTDSISDILTLFGNATPLINSINSREFPPGTFAAVVFALIERLTDVKTAQRVVDIFEEENELDPAVIAEVETSELRNRLADEGVRLGPKEAQLVTKLARWFTQNDDVDALNTEAIRDGLRALSGVGPATSDALLMYGFGHAAYPVDRGTYRIMVRHGWIDTTAEYDDVRSIIESGADHDASTLMVLSQSFEGISQRFCKNAAPKCERCPLRPFLPASGPIDPGA